MDWSKAKTILIIALLITNLVIGGFLASDYIHNINAEKEAVKSAEAYLSDLGISINCTVPAKASELPVLFVDFEAADKGKEIHYKGYVLDVTGSDRTVPVGSAAGEQKGKITGASKALLETALLHPEISSIEEVTLVYWIDRNGYELEGEDTAFPAWRVRTNMATYYIEALL